MGFDNSRSTFDPLNDYSQVVMQEGRVQLDADWNEEAAQRARRRRAQTLDILGLAAVPPSTPDAFRLTVVNNGSLDLTIGRGRMYVDGLLAENHGLAPLAPEWIPSPDGNPSAPAGAVWDPRLGELFGAALSYMAQPYYPNTPALPTDDGTYLFYLDVWQREVTYLERPGLVEKAAGVDTAGRLQTAWQVKWHGPVDTSTQTLNCFTDPRRFLYQSAGRLTTDFTVLARPADACPTPPGNVPEGVENQFYRVEIHQSGFARDPNNPMATFKWSRDNGSTATPILGISSSTGDTSSFDTLDVQSLHKDDRLAFAPGDWVEVTDDSRELNGQPGDLVQVLSTDAAAPVTRLLLHPDTSVLLAFQAGFHPRLRRWDQKGKVLTAAGEVYWDLDNPAAGLSVPPGAIPVPEAGTTLMLEDGITVAFDLDPAAAPGGKGIFSALDYWTFAGREVDGTVEKLAQAPPRGIHHHYASLGIATLEAASGFQVADCRRSWPPESGEGCCRSVQVKPGDDLKAIVEGYQGNPPGTEILLAAGTYNLREPIRLTGVHSNLTIQGCPGVLLQADPTLGDWSGFADGMVVVEWANHVTLRGIGFSIPTAIPQYTQWAGLPLGGNCPLGSQLRTFLGNLKVAIGIRPVNCETLTVEDCVFTNDGSRYEPPDFTAGVFAGGEMEGVRLLNNRFEFHGRIAGQVPTDPPSTYGPPAVVAGYLQAPSVELTQLTVQADASSSNNTLTATQEKVVASVLDDALFKDNFFDGVGVGVLALAACGRVQLIGNEVVDSFAGLWLVTPDWCEFLGYDSYTDDSGNLIAGEMTRLVVTALGYPVPSGFANVVTNDATFTGSSTNGDQAFLTLLEYSCPFQQPPRSTDLRILENKIRLLQPGSGTDYETYPGVLVAMDGELPEAVGSTLILNANRVQAFNSFYNLGAALPSSSAGQEMMRSSAGVMGVQSVSVSGNQVWQTTPYIPGEGNSYFYCLYLSDDSIVWGDGYGTPPTVAVTGNVLQDQANFFPEPGQWKLFNVLDLDLVNQ